MARYTPLVIAAAVLVPLAVVALTRKGGKPEVDLDPDAPDDDDPGEKGDVDVTPVNKIGKPIVVGEATDPSVAPYLATLSTRFINAGINVQKVQPFALTVMTKAPLTDGPDPDNDKTRPVAIPPLDMHEGLTFVASIVNEVIAQFDFPVRLTGYRPKDYNASVGGAPKSRHIYGDAIDVWLGTSLLASGDSAKIKAAREKLRMGFARFIVTHRDIAGFGFGVYTNDIHIDVGRKKGALVTWKQGATYIAKAKKELNIA